MSLEYLSKYLNKDGDKSKKRKRGTTRVVEDDLTGWESTALNQSFEDPPQVPGHTNSTRRSAGFRPAYLSPAPTADIEPDTQDNKDASTIMSNGTKAGLQTKEQVARAMKARREAEMKEASLLAPEAARKQQETVYRDATGRRIDITLAKQEKARELKRQEERVKKEKEMAQGLVQQQEKALRQAELEKVKSEGFSRYARDAEAERSMKEKRLWNDPAAAFLTNKSVPSGQTNSRTGPVYAGGFAPNRFGIRPGHRWDGVDRSNGYEAKRFKELANMQQRRNEYDDWAKEDM